MNNMYLQDGEKMYQIIVSEEVYWLIRQWQLDNRWTKRELSQAMIDLWMEHYGKHLKVPFNEYKKREF